MLSKLQGVRFEDHEARYRPENPAVEWHCQRQERQL